MPAPKVHYIICGVDGFKRPKSWKFVEILLLNIQSKRMMDVYDALRCQIHECATRCDFIILSHHMMCICDANTHFPIQRNRRPKCV